MLRGRADKGHWWGVVLDASDPQALGLFYAEMLGWKIYKNKPNEFVLEVPGGCEAYMSFQPQKSAEWVRPVWPAKDGHQQMMIHLDVGGRRAGDRRRTRRRAGRHCRRLSATGDRPRPLRPGRAPFCLYVGD